jgi:threonine dehydrogenase-like Zn-dependent dehydrogenase
MKTKAIRIYGKDDLRLDEFELPELREDEILAHVICDSICMSSYKATKQGTEHKRIPDDVNINPTIIGHEFSGEIVKSGNKWKDQFKPGMKFSIQPAINYPDGPVGILSAPGYSYRYIGGDATYIIIPNEVPIIIPGPVLMCTRWKLLTEETWPCLQVSVPWALQPSIM